ncbi:MAG TPA: ABC transporter permease [Pyrinomonadaceae bacterium]|jgi:putative ABC transport system permease protein|nr:ABC transporter permease [Pyrinomonadaceae bacterium]
MGTLQLDLRYAIRTLAKKPLFTIVAIATLALSIGANTAIFSVVNAVLLRALPYHNADRLVVLSTNSGGGNIDGMSVPEAEDYRAQMQTSLEDAAFFQSQSVNLTGTERPDRVRGAFVSANYFRFFNLNPITGRTFADGEDQQGGPKFAVVNEKMWRERLSGDANLNDKKLTLNGELYSVIGVVPESFKNPFDPDVEVWMPIANYPGNSNDRTGRFLWVMGHLKPGVTVEAAAAEANTVANRLAAAYPKENAGRTARLVSFREMMVRGVRPMLWLLFAAVAVILLIGCANLANLLLARGLDRHREVAVRAALGASRWRLIRELLTETTLIGVIGGGLGVFLAYWGLYGLLKLPQNFVNAQDANLDLRVLLFALAISVATGWLFGLAPALQFARPDLRSFLKEGARGGGEGARWNRLRSGFVIAQVALSLVLLVSAGLLIRSFDKLLRVNVGFKPEQLLSLEYRLPRNKYKEAPAQWAFHRQVMDRIQQVPGVQSVALVRGLPFSGNGATTAITLPDRDAPPKGREPEVMFNSATPNYFETIGIPFVKGRLFDDHDQPNTPPVVVINQTMARKFWPNDDPIGKQVKSVQDGTVATVIGVVGDAKHYWLEEEQMPQMYGAYSQQPGFFATVLIRTRVEPLSLSEQVRQALWKVDADQPMWKIRTVEFLVNRSVSDRKFLLALMGLFASLALVLTMIGLYGVISYLVKQRTQEIGIRIALGAQVRDILQMVLKQGMFLVLTGVALGLTTAWLTTRLIASLLYQVSATDPVTFAVIAAFLIVVALLACYLPARRATKVDPLVALRYE